MYSAEIYMIFFQTVFSINELPSPVRKYLGCLGNEVNVFRTPRYCFLHNPTPKWGRFWTGGENGNPWGFVYSKSVLVKPSSDKERISTMFREVSSCVQKKNVLNVSWFANSKRIFGTFFFSFEIISLIVWSNTKTWQGLVSCFFSQLVNILSFQWIVMSDPLFIYYKNIIFRGAIIFEDFVV